MIQQFVGRKLISAMLTKNTCVLFAGCLLAAQLWGCGRAQEEGSKPDSLPDLFLVDMHNDVLSGTVLKGFPIDQELDTGNTDLARLKKGKVCLQIFAVFGDDSFSDVAGYAYAQRQIDSLYAIAARHPDQLGIARTAAEAKSIAASGQIAGMLALEGGHLLGGNIDHLDSLHKRGVVYMTLTWNNSNRIASSSSDEENPDKVADAKGLTAWGHEIVARMNALGMIVDLSHSGEQTFYDVLKASRLPVIASHSNARVLSNVHRNLTDDQLRALAENGGMVGVNFYAPFLDEGYSGRIDSVMNVHADVIDSLKEVGFRTKDQLISAFLSARPEISRLLQVPIAKVVDHIDHIVKVAGVDHVGFGSDFFSLSTLPFPDELNDVSKYPFLIEALQARGYRDGDIRKIAGLNFLRVLEENMNASEKQKN